MTIPSGERTHPNSTGPTLHADAPDEIDVVGESHRNADGTDRQEIIARCRIGEAVALIPEPDNPFDKFAVKVCRFSGEQIGYLPRGCGLYAEIKRGVIEASIKAIFGGTPEKPTRGVLLEWCRKQPIATGRDAGVVIAGVFGLVLIAAGLWKLAEIQADRAASAAAVSSPPAPAAPPQPMPATTPAPVTHAESRVSDLPRIKRIQVALRDRGFDPGPTDGKIGARTKAAIRAFEADNGLPVDGEMSPALAAALGISDR